MLTADEIREILNRIEFQGWKFLATQVTRGGLPAEIYLQVHFIAPDVATGKDESWSGRKWLLSPHMTRSEIVQTAFKAVLTAVEHEAREAFLYKGRAIFGPHFDVDFLASYCDLPYTQDPRPQPEHTS